MSINHHFQVEEAKQYGVEVASILSQFRALLEFQRNLDSNYINDKYWIQTTERGIENIFPYIEKGKLKRILFKLNEMGLIQKGDFTKARSDKSIWFSMPEVAVQNHVTPTPITPVSTTEQAIAQPIAQPTVPNEAASHVQTPAPNYVNNVNQVDVAAKKSFGWVDIMPFAVEEVISRLVIQHGYDKEFYANIWQAFSAKMDADGEAVPTMDIARKRFLAYAQATMMNFKQGNYRYNATTEKNAKTRLNSIEKWRKYMGNPDPKIVNKLDLSQLQTPVLQVWDSYINKSYEREVPLKNVNQLEVGFRNYLATWIKNEKPKTYSNTSYTNSRSQIDFDDTSWANDLTLED